MAVALTPVALRTLKVTQMQQKVNKNYDLRRTIYEFQGNQGMKYRAQHWKDVPGVKYPEPKSEQTQVPPEGWLTGREAAEVLGWVFRPDISTRLHKMGVRCEPWKPAGRHRQLVWGVAASGKFGP